MSWPQIRQNRCADDHSRCHSQRGTYLSQHLRKNDSWAEGEKQVCGQAAAILGLEGTVTDAPFEALRANRDWQTDKRLTARSLWVSVTQASAAEMARDGLPPMIQTGRPPTI